MLIYLQKVDISYTTHRDFGWELFFSFTGEFKSESSSKDMRCNGSI